MAQPEATDRQDELYALPLASDTVEGGRLEEQHNALKSHLNGLFPCPEPVAEVLKTSEDQKKSVLDLGSGSGAWCLDVAHQFPDVQVVGIDISPNLLQSTASNCRFELWDINNGLSPFYGQFDLVHMRFIHGLTDHHASTLEAVKCLRPGGLILYLKAGPHVTEDRITLYPAASSRNPNGSWYQRFWYLTELGSTLRGVRSELFIRDYDEGFWEYNGIDPSSCGAAFITIPTTPWAMTSDPTETARLRKDGEFWRVNLLKMHRLIGHVAAASGRSQKDMEILHKHIDEELETARIRSLLTIRAIWGRACTIQNAQKELVPSQDAPIQILSKESGFQIMTHFDNKAAWTKFNTDLQSTMTSDTEGLRDIPNFDPMEE